jgi:hypothetical protein
LTGGYATVAIAEGPWAATAAKEAEMVADTEAKKEVDLQAWVHAKAIKGKEPGAAAWMPPQFQATLCHVI